MVKVSSNWKGETFTGSSGEVYKKYKSKEEGLLDIINTIKKYKTNDLNIIMGIYAKDDASGKRAANYENILSNNSNNAKDALPRIAAKLDIQPLSSLISINPL